MKRLKRHASLVVVACLAVMLSACDSSEEDGPDAFVEVLPGVDQCSIKQVDMPCRQVPNYAVNALKLKHGAYVMVRFDVEDKDQSRASYQVINDLKAAGYLVVGAIGATPIKKR